MLAIPAPSRTALTVSRRQSSVGSLATRSANAEIAIAIPSDVTVMGRLYVSRIGRESASMPMKCIDQIPTPMTTAPPVIQAIAAVPRAFATRDARLNAV